MTQLFAPWWFLTVILEEPCSDSWWHRAGRRAQRRADLEDRLTNKMRPMFAQRVLAITEDVMFRWRLMVDDARKNGHTFSQPNLIMAATAFHHGLTVVTRDTSDYRRACPGA